MVTFEGKTGISGKDFWYTSHNGYDYGRQAGASVGEPVLAAAGDLVSYHYNKLSGNSIFIDHGNGYQTRYFHMLKDGLVTASPTTTVHVNQGDPIGKIGSTGNSNGPHIHFMVVHDKDGNGNFDDNIPDGVVDPFGWQGSYDDPWPAYTFTYNGNRSGDQSPYLWEYELAESDSVLPVTGGSYKMGRYTLEFPAGSASENLNLHLKSSPSVKVSENIDSAGPAIDVTALSSTNVLKTSFPGKFTITADLAGFNLSRYIQDSISFYYTLDGINWFKETTSQLAADLKSITARPNHLTTFAVMGERIDTTAPITTAHFPITTDDGTNWLGKDTTITLTADDNGGLGVEYIFYKIDDGEWEEYTGSVPSTEMINGPHTIMFYSGDKDDNIEVTRSADFKVDKTPPQVNLNASKSYLWPVNGKMVDVQVDGNAEDNNLLPQKTSCQVTDEYGLIQLTSSGCRPNCSTGSQTLWR